MFTKQAPPSRFGKSLLALLINLVFLVSMSTPVFSQPRVSGTGGRSVTKKKTPQSSLRKRDRKSIDNEQIIPERITVEQSSVRTTAEIMAEQAARGNYKSPREILREAGLERAQVHPASRDRRRRPGRAVFRIAMGNHGDRWACAAGR